MRKLLIIVPSISYLGGLESVANTTVNVLKDNYDISLVYFYKTENELAIDENIKKICLDTPYSNNLLTQITTMFKRTKLLKKFKKNNNINISLSIGKTASISNALSKCNDKILTSIHSSGDISNNFIMKKLDKYIYNKSVKIICVCKGLANELKNTIKINDKKIYVLYNPFDISTIQDKSAEFCNEIKGTPALFSFGRIDKWKNYEMQIYALEKLLRTYPNAVLNILGDGDNKENLRTLANKLNLTKNVNFISKTTNPFKYLQKSDVFISTSQFEGFCNTIVEAFICKIPVISTDCKVGPRENIAPNSSIFDTANNVEFHENGILIPTMYDNDSTEEKNKKINILCTAITSLLKDKDLQKKYKNNGYKRAIELDISNYKKEIIKILEN